MTTSRQKELELKHLQNALKLAGVTDYLIIDKDGESPDFLIDISGEVIGVEVTSIYRNFGDGNSAKTESDLPVITEEAVKIYNKKGGVPVVFGFSFDGNIAVRSRREIANKIGDFLYEYMNKHFPQGITAIEKINVDNQDNESFNLIRAIFAQPTDHSAAVGFTVSGFNPLPVVEFIIKEAVRKKEKLLPRYSQRCDRIWLLVVLPAMNLAGDLTLQENKNLTLYSSFDSVYVLDDYRRRLTKVNNA